MATIFNFEKKWDSISNFSKTPQQYFASYEKSVAIYGTYSGSTAWFNYSVDNNVLQYRGNYSNIKCIQTKNGELYKGYYNTEGYFYINNIETEERVTEFNYTDTSNTLNTCDLAFYDVDVDTAVFVVYYTNSSSIRFVKVLRFSISSKELLSENKTSNYSSLSYDQCTSTTDGRYITFWLRTGSTYVTYHMFCCDTYNNIVRVNSTTASRTATIGILFASKGTFYFSKDGILYSMDMDSGIVSEKMSLSGLGFDVGGIAYSSVIADYHFVYIEGYSPYSVFEFNITEYNIEFKFVDYNGELKAKITNSLPIKNINLSYTENNITVGLTKIDNSIEYAIYNVSSVENKRFYGLNIIPEQRVALYLKGDNETSLYSDTTFYPVYQTYRPAGVSFELQLYRNSAEENRVDKTNYLTSVGTLSGAMREESSITDMSITIESESAPNFNYVYIPIFNRYYYVTDITTVRYKLWEISLSVDVLMTYRDSIKELNAFIDRNENIYNNNIIDKKRVIEQGYDVDEFTITNKLFDTSNSFVLSGFALKSNPIEE